MVRLIKSLIEKAPWIVGVIIFIFYYVLVELIDSGTRCVSKNLFGIPCPGCGMTRSYLHVLEGDFKAAYFDHPLFFTLPIIIIITALLFKKSLSKKLYRILNGILLFIAGLFIVVYFVRMFYYFPNQDPLKFYDRGLYPTIYRLIRTVIG